MNNSQKDENCLWMQSLCFAIDNQQTDHDIALRGLLKFRIAIDRVKYAYGLKDI